MGRVIVLNNAARAVRSPAVIQARQRHLHLQRRRPSTVVERTARALPQEQRSTLDRIEKIVWVVALWAMVIAYLIVRIPEDFGRSEVRFQCDPVPPAHRLPHPDASAESAASSINQRYVSNL